MMLYVDPTTSTASAVADMIDRYRDRTSRVPVGSRYRVDADTVGTVERVLMHAGTVAAVTVRTDAGFAVRVDVDPDPYRVPLTLADSVDRIRAARSAVAR